MARSIASFALTAVVLALAGGVAAPARAQNGDGWDPPRLADGQPDLNGTWNNVGSAHIPLELPEALAGADVSQEDIDALVQERSDARKAVTWQGHENSRGVGAYANYWFDWFWEGAVRGRRAGAAGRAGQRQDAGHDAGGGRERRLAPRAPARLVPRRWRPATAASRAAPTAS